MQSKEVLTSDEIFGMIKEYYNISKKIKPNENVKINIKYTIGI